MVGDKTLDPDAFPTFFKKEFWVMLEGKEFWVMLKGMLLIYSQNFMRKFWI